MLEPEVAERFLELEWRMREAEQRHYRTLSEAREKESQTIVTYVVMAYCLLIGYMLGIKRGKEIATTSDGDE